MHKTTTYVPRCIQASDTRPCVVVVSLAEAFVVVTIAVVVAGSVSERRQKVVNEHMSDFTRKQRSKSQRLILLLTGHERHNVAIACMHIYWRVVRADRHMIERDCMLLGRGFKGVLVVCENNE